MDSYVSQTFPGSCSEQPAQLLLLSAAKEDSASLAQMLRGSNWNLLVTHNCQEAQEVLDRVPVSVVLCEREIPDCSWKGFLRHLESRPNAPKLIVCSRMADELFWSEVLNLGGSDVLVKPFDQKEVAWVVTSALMGREAAQGEAPDCAASSACEQCPMCTAHRSSSVD